MGLKYLKGKSWAEITREERFFCAHLFHLIQKEGVAQFVDYLNRAHHASLPAEANWELGYELCFYRDVHRFRGKAGPPYSQKRTFDLALLSDDCIVVIEAKAHQKFDPGDLENYEKDKTELVKLTGVGSVWLAALASSRYDPPPEVLKYFDGPHLTWEKLASRYSDDPILLRADAVYEPQGRGGQNADGFMTGAELLAAHKRGENFLVGRGRRGWKGKLLEQDIESGSWEDQDYEVNRTDTAPPNTNWFWLREFMQRLGYDPPQ